MASPPKGFKNAEAVLNRTSHHRALDVGSLTGRLVAMENPQSLGSLHRVQCQGALLFQQQRRLNDIHLSNYLKLVIEGASADPTLLRNETSIVYRNIATLAYHILCKLSALNERVVALNSFQRELAEKEESVHQLAAQLEAAQLRHRVLHESDRMAQEIQGMPTVQATEASMDVTTSILRKEEEKHKFVEAASENVSTTTKAFLDHLQGTIVSLEAMVEEIKQVANAQTLDTPMMEADGFPPAGLIT
ncbi:hypothetical protein GNI_018760 [Gregarina niphandrodes]|uniref:Uncharacterized protein n=1 Tax=Gregarina niphandrodes TaxID=110365 RepID=A0A023BC44_GRENI|nr:hypothetical protein GNI_018760 [Gregarina niphandrodes]EZG81607.1 hypothetical protein GNI_018760 [Gregarina niphandrodes]|eukprot:XP_011134222.1 hypothetical protein GNI_018760 [Gregarina niphandrodes]